MRSLRIVNKCGVSILLFMSPIKNLGLKIYIKKKKKKRNLLAAYMISSTNSNPPEMLGKYFILAAQVFKFLS